MGGSLYEWGTVSMFSFYLQNGLLASDGSYTVEGNTVYFSPDGVHYTAFP
jgi:hypothetical protein